jgi:hypothetical protein
MRYAIDLLYLDAQDRVIKRVDALPPWRASACPGARCTLELAAGEAGRLGLKPGSQIDWRSERHHESHDSSHSGTST